MVVASTGRLLETLTDDHGQSWRSVVDLGLPLALVPEEAGGYGIGVDALATIVRSVAASDTVLPIAETMVANMLLAHLGRPPTDRPMALGIVGENGVIDRLAWSALASGVLIELQGQGELALVDAASLREVERRTSIDGTVRPIFAFAGSVPVVGRSAGGVGVILRCGAALRTIEMAGAADAALALTVEHVNTRQQLAGRSPNFRPSSNRSRTWRRMSQR